MNSFILHNERWIYNRRGWFWGGRGVCLRMDGVWLQYHNFGFWYATAVGGVGRRPRLHFFFVLSWPQAEAARYLRLPVPRQRFFWLLCAAMWKMKMCGHKGQCVTVPQTTDPILVFWGWLLGLPHYCLESWFLRFDGGTTHRSERVKC